MRGWTAIVSIALAAHVVPVPAQQIFHDGFETACDGSADTDLDRLGDCEEVALLTDPMDPDTDADGLPDGDEVLGTTGGLDLSAYGVDPRHKDLLVEIDWMVGPDCNAGFDRRPTSANVEQAQSIFANAPVSNPDGKPGIRLAVDYGQGGPFAGGNAIHAADSLLEGQIHEPDSEFRQLRSTHFPLQRRGYFRYGIFAWRYRSGSTLSSGQGEIGGDDFVVTLGCKINMFLGELHYTHALVHELGHNLRLDHGGIDACNYKPNYNSLMNYRYQFDGTDSDCDAISDYSLGDLSRGLRAPIDEWHVDESIGVCGSPVDWNHANGIETDVTVDLNGEDRKQFDHCGGFHTTLTDHDDWAAIRLDYLSPPGGGADQPEVATCPAAPQP